MLQLQLTRLLQLQLSILLQLQVSMLLKFRCSTIFPSWFHERNQGIYLFSYTRFWPLTPTQGHGPLGRMSQGPPGYLWFKYQSFLISGCQDMNPWKKLEILEFKEFYILNSSPIHWHGPWCRMPQSPMYLLSRYKCFLISHYNIDMSSRKNFHIKL